jgi:hypothetical protein
MREQVWWDRLSAPSCVVTTGVFNSQNRVNLFAEDLRTSCGDNVDVAGA